MAVFRAHNIRYFFYTGGDDSQSACHRISELARASAENLRRQQFLRKTLTPILASAYADPACAHEDYYFLGINDTSADGDMDSIEFCSSAPFSGSLSLPGVTQRVVVEIAGQDASDQTLDDWDATLGGTGSGGEDQPVLRVTGAPLVITRGLDLFDEATAAPTPGPSLDEDSDMGEATAATEQFREVPAETLDVLYFDGEEWVEEWDSLAMGRLPWAVRVRVNFPVPPDEDEADRPLGQDEEELADFDLIVPLPLGMGVRSEFIADEMIKDI